MNGTVELEMMEVGDDKEIALQAIHGIEKMGTIKLKGTIKGRSVIL